MTNFFHKHTQTLPLENKAFYPDPTDDQKTLSVVLINGPSLEGLMLKLKLQHFGHMMWRTDSSEKTLMLGKIEVRRRRGQQRMRWLDGITNSLDMSLASSRSWWWTGKPGVLQSMRLQRVGHDWVTELNFKKYFMKTRNQKERTNFLSNSYW